MRHTRTFCLAVAATAVTLGLTACGGASKGASSVGAVAAPKMASVADAMALVTKQTSAVTSMKVRMTETLPKIGTATASGLMSRNPLKGDMTISNPQLAQTLGTADVHVLMSGSVMYMNLGAQGAQELGGKHWMKLDFSSLGTAGQAMAKAMNQSSGQDPAAGIKLLTSSTGIKRVGQETVDGVSTTHYAGDVDVKQLAAQNLGTASDASLKTLVDQASGLGVNMEQVNVWVNAQNLPVRVSETADSTAGPVDITADYSDYSATPLTITPPPASDTVDFAELLKQAQAAQSNG